MDGERKRKRGSTSAGVPAALRLLLDFNQKGLSEVSPGLACRRGRAKRVADSTQAPKVPSHHKIWVLLDGCTHRRFRAHMGRSYQYKQHVPTPCWLRDHQYRFSVRVQGPGEMVVTVGASHYVVSGDTYGFSWSHADPSTLTRLQDSAEHHGSTQADGKPNTLSELFARSRTLLDGIAQNMQTEHWLQSPEAVLRQVRATRVDKTYELVRQSEGWLPEELRPLLLPTEHQFADPSWFAAMMLGLGQQHGSLHIRLPELYRWDPVHNFGLVDWPLKTPYHRFAVTRTANTQTTGRDRQSGLWDLVNVKVLRPGSKGFTCVSGYKPHVPTSPDALSQFISNLPNVCEPIYYCPQHPISQEQQRQLVALLPNWALPLSELDGFRNLFRDTAPGTTTPTAFGGLFGITGLHDEYNHTVSFFVFPFRHSTNAEDVPFDLAPDPEPPSAAYLPSQADTVVVCATMVPNDADTIVVS